MNFQIFIISISCILSTVISEPVLSPCPKDDSTCLTEMMRVLYTSVVSGNEALSIPPSDPLFQEQIDGHLSTLEYKAIKSTLRGFKDCEIETVRITETGNCAIFEMFCPCLKMTGDYIIDGELLVIPIKGDGEFSLEAREYHITVTADMERLIGSKGRSYIAFKDLRAESDLRGSFDLKLTNLFDGNKEEADKVNHFIYDNQKKVVNFLQKPVIEASVNCLFSNLNKVMKTIPVDHS